MPGAAGGDGEEGRWGGRLSTWIRPGERAPGGHDACHFATFSSCPTKYQNQQYFIGKIL